MSFPKAKLHRFNEEISCTPSPGKYDPKFDIKVKGVVIEKSKRFLSPNTIHVSTESLDSNASTSSCKPSQLGVFRTPQLKRKVCTTPLQRSRSQSQSGRSSNKEETIIDNLRTENKKLASELKSLNEGVLQDSIAEISSLKSQNKDLQILNKKLEDSCKNNNDQKDKLISTYTKELELKKEEIILLQENLQHTIVEKNNMQEIVSEKLLYCDTVNQKFSEMEKEFKKLQEEINKMASNHVEEIRKVNDAAELNFEMLSNTLSDRITDLVGEFDTAKMELQVDTEVSLSNVFNDFKMELKKLENHIYSGLNNIKEIESINQKKIKEFVTNLKESDERSKFLYQELCKVESERDDLVISDLEKKLTIVELQDECDNYESNLKIAKDKCKKYEVSVSKMQETIKALSDRLFASESEVERLNVVESDLKCHKTVLEEKVKTLVNEGLGLRRSVENMEQEIIQDVIRVEKDLVERLEVIKTDAQKEITYLKEEISVRDKDIVNKAACILDLTIKIDSLEDAKRQTEQLAKILETNLIETTEKHLKLENKLAEKDNTLMDVLKKNEHLEKKLKCVEQQLFEKEKEIKELDKLHQNKSTLESSPLQLYLDRIAKLEEEREELIKLKNLAQQEVHELDQQLGQLMGHQNAKQKIKHVEQLKLQNRFLKEELDRITAELARERKMNKENSLSLSPKLAKTATKLLRPSSSPNNIVLKDRNH